jgi:hypothetical protein
VAPLQRGAQESRISREITHGADQQSHDAENDRWR